MLDLRSMQETAGEGANGGKRTGCSNGDVVNQRLRKSKCSECVIVVRLRSRI